MSGIQFNPENTLQKILNDIPTYCGEIYEQVCLEYLLNKLSKTKNFIISEYGKWWTSKNNDEIDIVILDKKNVSAILAECKYRNKLTDISMVKEFYKRVNNFNWNKNKRTDFLYYFSKSGFTKTAITYCNKNKIIMIKKLNKI
jgi:hypothetical protein